MKGQSTFLFFSSAKSCSIGKRILGLPSWGSGRKASPAHPLVGLVSKLSKYEDFRVHTIPTFSTVICDLAYYGRGI